MTEIYSVHSCFLCQACLPILYPFTSHLSTTHTSTPSTSHSSSSAFCLSSLLHPPLHLPLLPPLHFPPLHYHHYWVGQFLLIQYFIKKKKKKKYRASQMALVVKNPRAGDTWDMGLITGSGRCPAGELGNPLQYLAWRIPWTEEPGRLQSVGSHRVGYDWVTNTLLLLLFLTSNVLIYALE